MPTRWLMLFVVFVVRLAMGFQFQSVASSADQLMSVFGFSYAEIGLLIGLFLVPGIVIAIPSGLLTSAFSDKTLLLFGALAMVVGAIVMGATIDVHVLYVGRILTGIGAVLFNVILTKVVTDWFAGKEIMTALGVMLTAWPIGIALGLMIQGQVAEQFGWSWVMKLAAAVALLALFVIATLYRDKPDLAAAKDGKLRFTLPRRQLLHVSVAGAIWTLFNSSLIVVVSFTPAALEAGGLESDAARWATSLVMWATLISLPLGARVMEVIGHVTVGIVATLFLSVCAIVCVSLNIAPLASCLLFGFAAGLPGGAMMAFSAQATSADNRGLGLGVFFTWYYVGMAICPALAGSARDLTGSATAPVLFAGALMLFTLLLVLLFRVMQKQWPIESQAAAT